jgi:hypothetical protein
VKKRPSSFKHQIKYFAFIVALSQNKINSSLLKAILCFEGHHKSYGLMY